MIKLLVGVRDLEHFAEIQTRSLCDFQGQLANPVWTRHKPKRDEELIVQGSIYRVIKNRIVCRQKIIGFESVQHEEKGRMCRIMVDPQIICTQAMPRKPFQGWRYLKPADAPGDIGPYVAGDCNEVPEDMEDDLREAGLI